MHRSLMSMQDMPVTSTQGLRLGGVQDAYFDPLEQRIVALVIDWENDLVRGPEDLLPITQIAELNADVLTVAHEMAASAGLEYEFQVQTEGLVLVNEALIGRPFRFASGEALGELVDVQWDPADGSVEAYELGTAEMTHDTRPALMVPTHPELEFRADGVVVPDKLKGLRPASVTFIEEDEEDLVGEEDIEVSRSPRINPF